MFSEIAPWVLIGITVLFVLVLLAEYGTWVDLDERRLVPADADRLRGPVGTLLANVRDGDVLDSGTGAFVLTVRRRPPWMVIFILFTLPFGLLLLSMKNTGVLLVAVAAVDGGADVRIVGRTSPAAQKLLDEALAPLEPASSKVSDR